MNLRLVQQYLEAPLGRTPKKDAVRDGKGALDYRELGVQSNRLAHSLRAQGVARQQRVVFCLERSANCLVAMLGILKADAVYVPIDPKSPPERWRSLFDDCQPAALVCDLRTVSRVIPLLAGWAERIPVIFLGRGEELAGEPRSRCLVLEETSCASDEPEYRNEESDIAYVLYTSGTTGKPKGVMISHSNIRNYIDWAVNHFELGPEERILGTAPFHFDMSTFDVYCSIKAGATLCIAAEGLTLFPEQLVRFIEGEGVTTWKGISSLLMYMERTGVVRKGRMPSLKKVLFGGEELPVKYLISWMQTYPERSFFNVYGPTEATGISLCYRVAEIPGDPLQRIPIGQPGKGAEVVLIGEDRTPTVPGGVGELCIAGPCLSPGYLNDREKTERAFIPHPLGGDRRLYRTGDLARLEKDGHYRFVGRKDRQVKYMGYRIELEDIERALLSVAGVRDAAALLVPSGTGGLEEICAFVEGVQELTPATVTGEMRRRLPSYMVPRRVVRVEWVPRSERGKISAEMLSEFVSGAGGPERC